MLTRVGYHAHTREQAEEEVCPVVEEGAATPTHVQRLLTHVQRLLPPTGGLVGVRDVAWVGIGSCHGHAEIRTAGSAK